MQMESSFETLIAAFEATNTKLWEVFSLSDEDLVKRVNRSVNEIRRFRAFSTSQLKQPTAQIALPDSQVIYSGIPEFDAMLGGGLRRRSVLEISGPAGVGKTCICSQIALENATSAVYFAAEERIPILCRRMQEILASQSSNSKRPSSAIQCRFAQIKTLAELRIGLNKLKLAPRQPSLIVIDSITALLGSATSDAAALELEELNLQKHAFESNAVILISNQIRDIQRPSSNLPIYHYAVQQLFIEGDASPQEELRKRPAYGMTLADHVSARVVLSRRPSSPIRLAQLVYSKFAGPGAIALDMTSAGLVGVIDGEDSDEDLLTYCSSLEPLTPASALS